MRMLLALVLLAFACAAAQAETGERYTGPIIDMHLHAYSDDSFWEPSPNPATGEMSVENADQHRERCIELMKRYNVVLAMVDGPAPATTQEWQDALGKDIIRGIAIVDPHRDLQLENFRAEIENESVELFGEVGVNYGGYSPSDSGLDPYFEICEQNNIPVGIHTGGSFPGIHRVMPTFRLRYGDPMLVEDVLVEYPDLRVYLMHAGGHFYENAAMMMVQYPELYVDIAVLNWVPDGGNFLVPFLKRAKEYAVLDRVMYGTDQMIWPEAIEMAIEKVQSLDFLTLEEKAGIFYRNAARFLNLTQETVDRHHQHR